MTAWGREPGYERPERMQGRASARKEIRKVKAALGAAGLRGDRRAAQYLAKRLASALAYAAHTNVLVAEDSDYE